MDILREGGHEVQYVAELEPGIGDEEVLEGANKSGALLMTGDKDFGELVFRQGRVTSGVVLLRLEGLTPGRRAHAVASAVSRHSEEFERNLVVITPGAVRIRRTVT